jgi:spore germination protein YaaH
MHSSLQKTFFLRIVCALMIAATFSLPLQGIAATTQKKTPPLEVSGWVPYWRVASSTADALRHISVFTELSPLAFSVRDDGTLIDHLRVASSTWQNFFTRAKENHVRVIPTITWTNGVAIDAVLGDPTRRKAHIRAILSAVTQYGADGIDIDYEGKKAETSRAFTLFLRDLYKAMGKKFVACTIEARTPLSSRFVVIPEGVTYANDFSALNSYCDRVRIMAYDQGGIDLTLNKSAQGVYQPIADTRWVTKVVELAAKEIARKKIVIGIPTYGREYVLTPKLFGGYTYTGLWTFAPNYARDIAATYGATPVRGYSGEMELRFMETSTPALSNEHDATTSLVLDGGSSTVATPPPSANKEHYLVWSDAQAIADKVTLARTLGVRGVAIFKIDGGEDQSLFEKLGK